MKIYAIALAVFIFCGFNACIQEMGVFNTIYSHENSFETNVDTAEIENLKHISGDDILSQQDMDNSNPDTGGISKVISSLQTLFNVIDKALCVGELIMEYTPPSARSTVAPFASFMTAIMWCIYGAGLISYYRKWSVD